MRYEVQGWLEWNELSSMDFIDPHLETCSQIAGSNTFVLDKFVVPGLGCHIFSLPRHGAKAGGDLHYVTVCGYRMKSKFILIDGRGLGESATELSSRLMEMIARIAGQPDNEQLLSEINTLAYHHADTIPALASVVAATFNDKDGSLTYAYAGHPNMLKRSEGQWRELPARAEGTLPAGMLRESKYYQATTNLRPGEWGMMYSNGVLDTATRQQPRHSPSALASLAASIPASTPEAFFRQFIEKLVEINHGTDFKDDLTLILVDRR